MMCLGSEDTPPERARENGMIVGFFPASTMPDADWWQALWPDPAKVLAEMGVKPGGVAIDLCCGDGLFTVPLARIAKRVYAIDIDPVMLDRARALVAEAPRRELRVCRGGRHGHRCGRAGAGRLRFPRQHVPRRP